MQEPDTGQETGASAAASGNGRGAVPLQLVDRSHLLRRSTDYPFPMPHRNGLVRIRRERRVFESFSKIRGLARSKKA